MRATLHLVTARDSLALRPVMQAAIERGFYPAARSPGQSRGWIWTRCSRRAGRSFRAAAQPGRAGSSAGRALAGSRSRLTRLHGQLSRPVGPGATARCLGSQRSSGLDAARDWLGRPLDADRSPDRAIERYLGAFGPASIADIRAWSGLNGLRDAVERLRPRLRIFRDKRGRELFDVPDGALPDPAAPAPPRFLPEFDNVLVAYAERSRILPTSIADAA